MLLAREADGEVGVHRGVIVLRARLAMSRRHRYGFPPTTFRYDDTAMDASLAGLAMRMECIGLGGVCALNLWMAEKILRPHQ
jgi:hypothetical protein